MRTRITRENITPELVKAAVGTELMEDEMVVLLRSHYMIQTTFGVGPVILEMAVPPATPMPYNES